MLNRCSQQHTVRSVIGLFFNRPDTVGLVDSLLKEMKSRNIEGGIENVPSRSCVRLFRQQEG